MMLIFIYFDICLVLFYIISKKRWRVYKGCFLVEIFEEKEGILEW